MNNDSSITRSLAPEEIRPGQYVAVLSILHEHLPCRCLLPDLPETPTEPLRLRWLPDTGGTPLEVISVCLPFVLVRTPARRVRTLDLRRYRLARLTRAYGLRATAEMRRDIERRRKKSSRPGA